MSSVSLTVYINDKVYLLSYKDVTEKYFTTGSERQAKVTDYAKNKVVHTRDDYGSFWLRSPNNSSSDYVNYVEYYGDMIIGYCYYSGNGVRPAIEIKIK